MKIKDIVVVCEVEGPDGKKERKEVRIAASWTDGLENVSVRTERSGESHIGEVDEMSLEDYCSQELGEY